MTYRASEVTACTYVYVAKHLLPVTAIHSLYFYVQEEHFNIKLFNFSEKQSLCKVASISSLSKSMYYTDQLSIKRTGEYF